MVLITYHFDGIGTLLSGQYCYSISNTVEEFIDETKDYVDGTYIIVNVIEITDAQAKKWDGALPGM